MTDPVTRVHRVLKAARLKPRSVARISSGQTNEVWRTDSHVIRINTAVNDTRLSREARILDKLAGVIPCPRVTCSGHSSTMEWLVLERIPGSMLTSAWAGMDQDQRRQAVGQLAGILKQLHAVDTWWLDQLPFPPPQCELAGHGPAVAIQAASAAKAAVDSLRGLPFVETGILHAALGFIQHHGHIFDTVASGLIHGDVHFDNVLWRDGRIVGIVDFEYSRLAPVDLELDILQRFCAFPYLFVAEEREEAARPELFEEVQAWLAEEYPALYAAPYLRERLACYSLIYDLSMLVRHPPTKTVELLSPAHPSARLYNTVAALTRR
ncbi:MAG: aminoglycoside phosphotransferase family protein [Bacillota bacterium]|nr:aminoglycoside phosphotransferase family protein [Bacillota bacterium]